MSIVTPERPVEAAGAPTRSRSRHTWWHAFNSVIALGAATLGVIALTRDPATATVEVPAPAATPSSLASSWLGDPGPALGIPSDSYADAVPAPAATPSSLASSWLGDPGPALGIPSDSYADALPAPSLAGATSLPLPSLGCDPVACGAAYLNIPVDRLRAELTEDALAADGTVVELLLQRVDAVAEARFAHAGRNDGPQQAAAMRLIDKQHYDIRFLIVLGADEASPRPL
jgi:hypothetical protein